MVYQLHFVVKRSGQWPSLGTWHEHETPAPAARSHPAAEAPWLRLCSETTTTTTALQSVAPSQAQRCPSAAAAPAPAPAPPPPLLHGPQRSEASQRCARAPSVSPPPPPPPPAAAPQQAPASAPPPSLLHAVAQPLDPPPGASLPRLPPRRRAPLRRLPASGLRRAPPPAPLRAPAPLPWPGYGAHAPPPPLSVPRRASAAGRDLAPPCARRSCQLGGALLSVGRGVFVSWAGRPCCSPGPPPSDPRRRAGQGRAPLFEHGSGRWLLCSICRRVGGPLAAAAIAGIVAPGAGRRDLGRQSLGSPCLLLLLRLRPQPQALLGLRAGGR
jgi:hypothetical protein